MKRLLRRMGKYIPPLMALITIFSTPTIQVLAATDADIDVTATPAFVGISCDQTVYNFGVVAASATPSTTTSWATITNTSTVQTDQTISVTTTVWAGGVTWAHAEDGIPGSDIAGLKTNRGGTWGVGDVIIKNGTPNFIYENCPALTGYSFGLKLWAPTAFGDGIEKSITVRVSAVSG